MHRKLILAWLLVLTGAVAPQLSMGKNENSEPARGIWTADSEERYRVVFNYEVKNKTKEPLQSVKVFIPLPNDDDGQKLSNFRVIEPTPGTSQQRVTDQFGQPILETTIASMAPGATKTLGFECDATLLPVRIKLDRDKCGKLSDIPKEILSLYGGNLPGVYDTDSPIIDKEAQRLKALYPNPVDRVLAIHDLVAGRITYSLGGGWSPAPAVFERKTGSCSEYSFLFASLCRATGLPTRMVGSSHLRTQTKFPYTDTAWHRWVEVYIPGLGWVPFDPTLDRGRQPKHECCGSYDFRTLRVSRGGCESNFLGQAYVGTNDHGKATAHSKSFIWTKL